MIIGTFTKSGADLTGTIVTATLNLKVKLVANERDSEKAPDYRLLAGKAEIGAAWAKTSKAGNDYHSVKIDDPTWPEPIYASLIAAEEGDGFNLIWSRRNGD